MKQKTYIMITGIIFLVVAVLHFARIIFNWQILIGGLTIPLWISWAGFVVAGILACLGFKLSKKA
jgi:hypothetical protein